MNSIIHTETGFVQYDRHLVKGYDKMILQTYFSNKLGRLAQGVGNIVYGSNTIFFFTKSQLPQVWKVTYGKIVCDIKPQKYETYRTILTVGGNLIDYPGEVTTTTSDITTSKTLINSTISTPDARFLCAYISNFYLNTPMDDYKYM